MAPITSDATHVTRPNTTQQQPSMMRYPKAAPTVSRDRHGCCDSLPQVARNEKERRLTAVVATCRHRGVVLGGEGLDAAQWHATRRRETSQRAAERTGARGNLPQWSTVASASVSLGLPSPSPLPRLPSWVRCPVASLVPFLPVRLRWLEVRRFLCEGDSSDGRQGRSRGSERGEGGRGKGQAEPSAVEHHSLRVTARHSPPPCCGATSGSRRVGQWLTGWACWPPFAPLWQTEIPHAQRANTEMACTATCRHPPVALCAWHSGPGRGRRTLKAHEQQRHSSRATHSHATRVRKRLLAAPIRWCVCPL
jgi:hypothetical protein